MQIRTFPPTLSGRLLQGFQIPLSKHADHLIIMSGLGAETRVIGQPISESFPGLETKGVHLDQQLSSETPTSGGDES